MLRTIKYQTQERSPREDLRVKKDMRECLLNFRMRIVSCNLELYLITPSDLAPYTIIMIISIYYLFIAILFTLNSLYLLVNFLKNRILVDQIPRLS